MIPEQATGSAGAAGGRSTSLGDFSGNGSARNAALGDVAGKGSAREPGTDTFRKILVLLMSAIPLVALYLGTQFLLQVRMEHRRTLKLDLLRRKVAQLTAYISHDEFWCRTWQRKLRIAAGSADPLPVFERAWTNLRRQFGAPGEAFLYDKDKGLLWKKGSLLPHGFQSFPGGSDAEWLEFSHLIRGWLLERSTPQRLLDLGSRLFGDKVNTLVIDKSSLPIGPLLLPIGRGPERRSLFCAARGNLVLLVFHRKELLENFPGVRYFVRVHERTLADTHGVHLVMAHMGKRWKLDTGGRPPPAALKDLVPLLGSFHDVEREQGDFTFLIQPPQEMAGDMDQPIFGREAWLIGYFPTWENWEKPLRESRGWLLLASFHGLAMACFVLGLIRPPPILSPSLGNLLVLLLVFAMSLPLSGVGIMMMDYWRQAHKASLSTISDDIGGLLQSLDKRYPDSFTRMARRIRARKPRLEAILSKSGSRPEANRLIKTLLDWPALRTFFMVEPGEPGMMSREGFLPRGRDDLEHVALQDPRGRRPFTNGGVFTHYLGRLFLSRFNGESSTERAIQEAEMAFEAISGRPLAYTLNVVAEGLGRISAVPFMGSNNFLFLDLLKLPNSPRKADFFLMVGFDNARLQNDYLHQQIGRLRKFRPELRLFACQAKWDLLNHQEIPREFRRFLGRLKLPGHVLSETIRLRGRDLLCFALNCSLMEDVFLMATIPADHLWDPISQVQHRLWWAMGVSILLAVILSLQLRRIFLRPVGDLARGIAAIQAGRFQEQVPELDRDELGEVGSILNHLLGGLDELRGAAAIQRNLFPQADLSQHAFHVRARNRSLSQVGGDYFDYFIIDDSHLGLLIGDVAGHGVQAAMTMALAKVFIQGARELWKDPLEVARRIDSRLVGLSRPGLPKFMTFFYACVETTTGTVQFLRAGHPYPILVRGAARTAEWRKSVGQMVGSGRAGRSKVDTLHLDPGDGLIVYTDGFVEGRNERGTPFGFEELRQAAEQRTHELETFPEHLFRIHDTYRGSIPQGDDLTVLVLYRSESS